MTNDHQNTIRVCIVFVMPMVASIASYNTHILFHTSVGLCVDFVLSLTQKEPHSTRENGSAIADVEQQQEWFIQIAWQNRHRQQPSTQATKKLVYKHAVLIQKYAMEASLWAYKWATVRSRRRLRARAHAHSIPRRDI